MNTLYDLYMLRLCVYNFINYSYIVVDKLRKDALVVDPAWEIDKIVNILKENDANLTSILLTHSHYDHTNLVDPLVKRFGVNVYISKKEMEFYGFRCRNLVPIEDNDKIKIGDSVITCIHTPGHTAGGMCYLLSDSLFTGDTVFIEGCGGCYGEGSDPEKLYDSIQRIKREVSMSVYVYPGHSYGKSPGYSLKSIINDNIYFQFDQKNMFVDFRMRKNQKNIFSFR